jgi:hypothetical protein
MSSEVTINEIKVKDHVIPGGWRMKIPSIRAEPAEEQVYVSYHIRQGMTPKEAQEHVQRTLQAKFNYSWAKNCKQMIRRCAFYYLRRWPELELRGYNPAKMALTYIPGELHKGIGLPPIKKRILAEMAHAQTEREMAGASE